MHSDRTLTTPYLLLPGATALAILVTIAGCDPDRERDNSAQPSSNITSTESATGDTRLRDQRVAGLPGESATNTQDRPVESALARIQPTSAGKAEGTATFSAGEDDREMRVTIELTGLEPGPHGFHVHAVGDCSADDASSAGGHFNPHDTAHGSPGEAEHHAGDMGNIEADADGQVSSELSFPGLAFSGPASILEKAVVIHQYADDLQSQPAGDAGNRVGCGVIQSENSRTPEYSRTSN